MAIFKESFAKEVLGFEGGKVNHPNDKGKLTNKGVTWDTFVALCKTVLGVAPTQYIFDNLTDAQVIKFVQYFWNISKACKINSQGIAEYYADFYWGSGKYAITTLQNTLNSFYGKRLVVDGVLGPLTLSSVNSLNAADFLEKYHIMRKKFYDNIVSNDATQYVFLKGWLARAEDLFTKKKALLPQGA